MSEELLDGSFEPFHALIRGSNSLDHLLQGDLMGGKVDALFLRPS